MKTPGKIAKVKAAAMMARLTATFHAEMPSKLDAMESSVLGLSHAPDIFETLYRQVHSLKGSSGMYGLPAVGQVCHDFEEALNQFESEDDDFEEKIDQYLAYVDLMRQVSRVDDETNSSATVINQLAEIRETVHSTEKHGLIVDESRLNVALYQGVWEGLPIRFNICTDGYEAAGKLLNYSYDIVICGFEIPVLNGVGLIAVARLCVHPQPVTVLLATNEAVDLPKEVGPDHIIKRDGEVGDNLYRVVAGICKD